MATVLYITAHPGPETTSTSQKVGKAFIDAYRAAAPGDEIVHLDLYKMDIPFIDADVLSAIAKLRSGTAFDQLAAEEKSKVGRMSEIRNQFSAADKWVFVSPMWNFGVPPLLKAYIDCIITPGKTFKHTAEGPVGLLTNKAAIHIQSSGSVYTSGPLADMDHSHRWLNDCLHKFVGVDSFEGLMMEGFTGATPERAEQIVADALKKAPEAAKRFAALAATNA